MDTSTFPPIVIVIGTFLPIIRVGLSLVIGIARKGLARWLVLYLGPAVTAIICNAIAEGIVENGNMFGMIIYLSLFIFLVLYYPILTIYAGVIAYRIRKLKRALSS